MPDVVKIARDLVPLVEREAANCEALVTMPATGLVVNQMSSCQV